MAGSPPSSNPGVVTALNGEKRDRRDGGVSDGALRGVVGYRVSGGGRDLGVIVALRASGVPPRPLVLVVRHRDTMRLLSPARIVAVDPLGQRVLVEPEMGPQPDGGRSVRGRASGSTSTRVRGVDRERSARTRR